MGGQVKSVKDRIDEATNEVNATVDRLKPSAHQVDHGNPNNPNHPDNIGNKPREKPIVNVQIVGFDIGFWNLVLFMVTVAIAAIPAIIILFIIVSAVMMMVGAGFSGFAGITR